MNNYFRFCCYHNIPHNSTCSKLFIPGFQQGISCGPWNCVISHMQDNTDSKWSEKNILLLSQKVLAILMLGGGNIERFQFSWTPAQCLIENMWGGWPGVHGNWGITVTLHHISSSCNSLSLFCKSHILYLVRNWQYPVWVIVMVYGSIQINKYARNRKKVSAGVIDTITALGNVSWTFYFLFTAMKGVSLVQLYLAAYLAQHIGMNLL